MADLRVLHDKDIDRERVRLERLRQDRQARVEACYVDRSRFDRMPTQPWSVEALDHGELRRYHERSEVTLREKMHAWAVLSDGRLR